MNALIISIPLSMLFMYGYFNLRTTGTARDHQAGKARACYNEGSWLSKGWILGIIMLMLILSKTGL